MAATYCMR